MFQRMTCVRGVAAAAGLLFACGAASAAIEFDQNVTPDVIFGTGNANGGFTTDRANGVELGMRGKLRYNAMGQPENIYNSNGDGSYTFNAGVAPTQAFPTAVWSVEFSINSNYDGSSGWNLSDLTYGLSMTSTVGPAFGPIDVVNGVNPAIGVVYWDHAIGTNATGNGGGTVAGSVPGYQTLIDNNNVAQNSQRAHVLIPGFDPDALGEYVFTLSAFDPVVGLVASTSITIQVVPAPGAAGLLALGGLVAARRRRA
jgi:hypothetical protein